MKIIQVIPMFSVGGAEIMCENLIYALCERGHDVVAISMFDYHSAITDRLEQRGIDIRYLEKKPGLDFSMVWKIRKILIKEQADAVHTHLYCAQYAVPAAIIAGVKRCVHTIHSVARKENGTLARKLNKFFFKHCGVIPVALSETVRDSVIEEYSMSKDQVPVIFNGIDLSRCCPKKDYTTKGMFKILHVGRFVEAKNHSGLLQAFSRFHDTYPDSELWLIGDGEKRTEAEGYVTKNGLADSVKFLGLQSNVYGYLHDADVFTLPSIYEGMPITLIEAMGTGLPIVATNVGGIPDMLDNENALLVPVDSNAIAEAFENYYKDVDLRRQHGERAREHSAKFGALMMANQYEHIYLMNIDKRK